MADYHGKLSICAFAGGAGFLTRDLDLPNHPGVTSRQRPWQSDAKEALISRLSLMQSADPLAKLAALESKRGCGIADLDVCYTAGIFPDDSPKSRSPNSRAA